MTAVRVDGEGHPLSAAPKQSGEGGVRDGGMERSRSGTSRPQGRDAEKAVRDAGVDLMLEVLKPNLQRRDVRDQIAGSERSASVKDGRRKMDRDLSSIRREDVERKREEIGKERPRVRDENERRKEALALLRFKLEAHVRRTERKAALEGRRGVDGGEQQRGKLGNRGAERVKVQETESEEEAVVIVSGSPPPELTARPDAAQIGGTEGPVAGYGGSDCSDNVCLSDSRALPSAAGEESNVAVKDIYVVESATSAKWPTGDGCNDGREGGRLSSSELLAYPEEDAIQVPSKAFNKSSSKGEAASHYKLAEKVARLMEDLEDPALTDSNLPRLQVRVMDDSETGPIVLMKCSSRDHARVICETLSSKLGPQDTFLTDTSEGTKRQQYHFQFKGPNLLTFLKKAFSSKARSKSRQKATDRASSTGNEYDSQAYDSAMFDSGYFNDGSKVFSGHMREYLAATWGQEATRPSFGSRGISDGKPELGVRERVKDDDVRDAQGRRVRSANSSPAVFDAPSDSVGTSKSKSRYFAGLLATPARTLDRATSVGRHRSAQVSGDGKTQGRFFGFVSPGRGALQHSFEDRLGPAMLGGEAKAEKTKNKARHFGVLQSLKKKKKPAGAGGESPLHDRERWSGMLVGSPGADRGRGLGGAGSGDQRWGFLGGIGSPVRDHRRGGNGWGSLYSLTDVSADSGTEENKDSIEEPTSPEVTCIGRVRARAPRYSRDGDARSDVSEKPEASNPLHHTWSAADSTTRKARAQPRAPFSGPLLRPSIPELQAPQAPLPLVPPQVKHGRWKALLGLYRTKAAGEKSAALQEPNRDVCLSRCRKTSFDRFGSHLGDLPEQGTDEPEVSESERDTDGENPVHQEPTGLHSGHLLLDDVSKEDMSHVVDSPPQNQDEGTDSLQCVLLRGNSIARQSALWERRQFSKPRALAISGTF